MIKFKRVCLNYKLILFYFKINIKIYNKNLNIMIFVKITLNKNYYKIIYHKI